MIYKHQQQSINDKSVSRTQVFERGRGDEGVVARGALRAVQHAEEDDGAWWFI